MTTFDTLVALGQQIDSNQAELTRLDSYFAGAQPAAFLSAKAREALGTTFKQLSVNVPRLAVTALSERLKITGFRLDNAEQPDEDLWRIWRRNNLREMSAAAHVDALALGRSFAIVWSGKDRDTPRVTVESARQVAVGWDPATREVTAACKRWVDGGRGWAVVFEADRITKYVTQGPVAAGAGIPSTGWNVREVLANPLGTVPVVPILNRGRLLQFDGVSEMTDLLPLADALNKLMSDLMTTSEYFARPRRWATGLELIEARDENGQVIPDKFVDPFPNADALRTFQSESPDTKFGQFPQADLSSYRDAIAIVMRQMASLAALPPHYVGVLAEANPTSADALRAAEAMLVSRAFERMTSFTHAWAEIARLIVAVRSGADTRDLDVEPMWASPETSSPGMEADAVTKLVTAGILPKSAALERLGYQPGEIARIESMRAADALTEQGVDLSVAA